MVERAVRTATVIAEAVGLNLAGPRPDVVRRLGGTVFFLIMSLQTEVTTPQKASALSDFLSLGVKDMVASKLPLRAAIYTPPETYEEAVLVAEQNC